MAKPKTILWIVLIAQFMVILDLTIVTVALPSISTSLGFGGENQPQWVVNAYSLLFGGFLLFGGRAGDLLGRQRLLIIGLALFGLSSLVSGLAPNPETLIIGRGAGIGRRADLARCPVDHHRDLRRRRRAQQSSRLVQRGHRIG